MNNNWWTENIRATNPCVTADTRLATQFGMVRIGDLYDARVDIQATVDGRALGEGLGVAVRPAVPAFMTSSSADVYRVVTQDGYEIKATEWHDFYTSRGKIKLRVPEIVWRGNEDCVKGYLRGLFQTDGTVQRNDKNVHCTIRLASSKQSLLKDVQMLLANFGIFCRVQKRRAAGQRLMSDGKGGKRLYDCQADYELNIGSESRDYFMEKIGFLTDEKNDKYREWKLERKSARCEEFVSSIAAIDYVGREAVFDTTQPDRNNLIFNGIVTGNCGEQPLPAYGSCLLGSVNLTKFVLEPFTDNARFDWETSRKVVQRCTRMLCHAVG